jgi:ATP-dependent helicase/nuclease subunit A
MGLVIYQCSAGSGKTFTLVGRFLTHTIGQSSLFKQILAITFTNKAAEELKTRIIQDLDRIASGRKSKQLEQLTKAFPNLNTEEIRARAAEILDRIIHDYGAFAVSTIDSYFQILARTLAREMNLPMRYSIELDQEAISRTLTDMTIEEAGRDKEITFMLESMLFDLVDADEGWDINGHIHGMAKEMMKSSTNASDLLSHDPQRINALINWMRAYQKAYISELSTYIAEFIKLCNTYGLQPDDFAGKSKGIHNYFTSIEKRAGDSEYTAKFLNQLAKLNEDPEAMWQGKSTKKKELPGVAKSEFAPVFRNMQEHIGSKFKIHTTCTVTLKHIWKAGISGFLDQKFKQFREEQQVFHLSDTTRLLSEAVQNDDTPFIFEKTGNAFRHIFIDEFQDTSTEQWNILKPLVLNTLANGNEVMIVGDAKQSIYRFRGGDISLILKKVAQEIGVIGYDTKHERLEINWRSQPEVVGFNNKLFPALALIESARLGAGSELLQDAYQDKNVEQKTEHKTGLGSVHLRFFRKDGSSREGDENETGEDIKWKKQACMALSKQVEALIRDGFRYRDITVLVYTTSEETEIAKHLLEENKHPFIASNSLKLANNAQVLLVFSAIRWIAEPDNRLLQSEIDRMQQPEVLREHIPFQKPSAASPRSWTKEQLGPHRSSLSKLPLQLAFHRLCELLGLDFSTPYIQKLNDIVLEHVASGGDSLSGFVRWWDEHVESRNWSVELPAGSNAIRIMTIHSSKGLEFPVVFLPFIAWKLEPKADSILWAEPEPGPLDGHGKLPVSSVKGLAETLYATAYKQELLDTALDKLNMFYVAFTRAAVRLYGYSEAKPARATAGDLLIKTIESISEWNEQFVAKEGLALDVGEDKPFHEKQETESGQEDPFYNPAPLIDELLFETTNTGNAPLTPLRFVTKSEEMRLGDIIHSLLEQPYHSNMHEAYMQRMELHLRFHPDPLARNKQDHIRQTILKTLTLLDQQGWNGTGYRVATESELFETNSADPLQRPDRILFGPNKTIVIDFKTGAAEKKHHTQVERYCALLNAAGYGPTEGYLIYTGEQKVVKVV